MKKVAIFICLLAVGAFVANAQNEAQRQGTPKTQNGSNTSTAQPALSNSPNATNSGAISTSEGTMSNSGMNSMHNGTKLQISDLPKAVSQNITSQHKGWTPKEVYKIDNQGATAYEVVVNKKDDEMNLVYDSNGNLLRTEQHGSVDFGDNSSKRAPK